MPGARRRSAYSFLRRRGLAHAEARETVEAVADLVERDQPYTAEGRARGSVGPVGGYVFLAHLLAGGDDYDNDCGCRPSKECPEHMGLGVKG